MRILLLLSSFILSFTVVQAQQFEWVNPSLIDYAGNSTARSIGLVRPANSGDIWAARTDSFATLYSLDVLGTVVVEKVDPLGNVLMSLSLGPKVTLFDMEETVNGDLVITGFFIDSMLLNNSHLVPDANTVAQRNSFMVSFDATGVVNWAHNHSLTMANTSMGRLSEAPDGTLWASTRDFNNCYLQPVDSAGNLGTAVVLDNASTLGDFEFDAGGNCYVTGATSTGTMTIGTYSVPVPEQYMVYIARLGADMNGKWILLAHDITHQLPDLATGEDGMVYVLGDLSDTMSWGGQPLYGADWVYDFFMVAVDSSSNVHWVKEVPNSLVGVTGDFQRAKRQGLWVNDDGDIYFGGTLRGSVNWGNSIISTTGEPLGSAGSLGVVKFKSDGTALWTKTVTSFGVRTFEDINGIQKDVYLSSTHRYEDTLSFDGIEVILSQAAATLLSKIPFLQTPGVNEESAGSAQLLYPNPATRFVVIPSEWKAPVVVYNYAGQEVMRSQKTNGKLNVEELPAGFYLLVSGEFSGKLLVERNW